MDKVEERIAPMSALMHLKMAYLRLYNIPTLLLDLELGIQWLISFLLSR